MVIYQERLWPGPWFWAMTLGMVVAVAIAYGAALSPMLGWAALAAGAAAVMWLGWRLAVRVEVHGDGLAAGRAKLPWEQTGRALALTPEQLSRATGPAGDRTAWIVSAPGAASGAVLLEVMDDTDPHRTWLVSSRRPESLVRAIGVARGRLGE